MWQTVRRTVELRREADIKASPPQMELITFVSSLICAHLSKRRSRQAMAGENKGVVERKGRKPESQFLYKLWW